jgi:hypothetical protein
MTTGILKIVPDRGFGVITPDKGGNDVFVHVSETERTGFIFNKVCASALRFDKIERQVGRALRIYGFSRLRRVCQDGDLTPPCIEVTANETEKPCGADGCPCGRPREGAPADVEDEPN